MVTVKKVGTVNKVMTEVTASGNSEEGVDSEEGGDSEEGDDSGRRL